MKINWKLRLKNKVTLMSIVTIILWIVYTVLSWFGIVPTIGQEAVERVIEAFLTVLVIVGIIADPTTEGLSDSERAMMYEKPRGDK